MGRDAVAADEAFTSFVATTEPRLRRALVAGFGPEVGADASAEAMAFAWQNWDRVRVKPNPVGYLFGVGRNQARRHRVDRVGFTLRPPEAEPWVEPGLAAAVASLSERQRVVVLLVHGSGWTQREVAELLGLSLSSVQRHLERVMAKLRRRIGVET